MSSGTGRRLSSKHLDRKEKFHGSQERPPPPGSTTGPAEAPPTLSTGGDGGKGRGRKETVSQHDHKRRKEEENVSSGLDSRTTSKKRKRDQVDDEPPAIEAKKPRTGDQHHHPPSTKDADRMSRSREGGGAVGGATVGGGGTGTEGPDNRSSGDRKRRHDSAAKDVQPPPRKHVRSRSPESLKNVSSGPGNASGSGGSTRRHERHGSGSKPVTSPNSKKSANEHHRSKVSAKKTESESTEENETSSNVPAAPTATGDPSSAPSTENTRKKLDWAAVSNYTQKASTKLERRSSSVLERFTPGAIFARTGVSPDLAGSEYLNTISSLVSKHLKKSYSQNQKATDESGSERSVLPDSLVDSPFEGQQFASSGVSRIKEHLDWEHLIVDNVGPCRRALTASADYAIRKKLKKSNQVSRP